MLILCYNLYFFFLADLCNGFRHLPGFYEFLFIFRNNKYVIFITSLIYCTGNNNNKKIRFYYNARFIVRVYIYYYIVYINYSIDRRK